MRERALTLLSLSYPFREGSKGGRGVVLGGLRGREISGRRVSLTTVVAAAPFLSTLLVDGGASSLSFLDCNPYPHSSSSSRPNSTSSRRMLKFTPPPPPTPLRYDPAVTFVDTQHSAVSGDVAESVQVRDLRRRRRPRVLITTTKKQTKKKSSGGPASPSTASCGPGRDGVLLRVDDPQTP